MVLHGLKRYSDVDLKWLASLCCEERRQLVHLLVILDDGCEALRPCVLAECAEVLSQEVLWQRLGDSLLSSTASRPAVIALANSMMICAKIWTCTSCSMSATLWRTDLSLIHI